MKRFLESITSTKCWLIIGSIGIWILVFQNFGVFGEKSQLVYVTGGDIDADVSGSVSIDNTVDVNLYKINGYRNCFYNDNYRHPNDYYRIPVAY